MADDTNTAEREAAEQWLRDRYGAYRGHFAWRELEEAFLAGRASLAASAGSEPVAWRDPSNMCDDQSFTLSRERAKKWPHIYKQPLYTHPSPPEGMAGWISVDERLPESGTPVLLDIGKKYPIRAMWAPAKTLEASNDSDAVGDYDEATDTYYCPEGWYEWNQHEETHWFVTETPRAWMPLPASEEKEL